MVEVVRTNFLPIFSDFHILFGHSGTNRNATDNFENCSIGCKGLFFRKKRCKPHLNCLQMSTLCLVEVTQLRTKALFCEKSPIQPMETVFKIVARWRYD